MAKKGKSKGKKSGISKIKQKNIKGGKMSKGKKTGSKAVVQARKKLQTAIRNKAKNIGKHVPGQTEEVTTEDVLDMLDSNELSYFRDEKFKNNQYVVKSAFAKLNKQSLKRHFDDDENLENKYETKLSKEAESSKRMKLLLPIKTAQGIKNQQVEEYSDAEEETNFVENDGPTNSEGTELAMLKHSKHNFISTAMLLSERRKKLSEYKVKIGILSASFLEDPENRLKNVDNLIDMIETTEASVVFTVPKLACVSLLSVFQDVLPSYAIKHHNTEGIKLKSDTKKLQGHEASLLKRYKLYLQKLEKMVSKFCPRKRSNANTANSEAERKLGKIALNCMCKMLLSHPYFNMAVNIVNFVVPFLNNWDKSVREIIVSVLKSVFRIDKRGELSYEIVRRINILVKSKYANGKFGVIHQDVLDPLLALRIKEADLEKEKHAELNQGSKMNHLQRKMLSKRQKKKSKELQKLEQELLEASAEENKSKKSHFLTEITKLVFTIYFRTLKSAPNPTLLSAVLEGLARFAHVINVDFFDDLLKVLESLLSNGELQQRQKLLCVATVLSVLDGQGVALTLDPTAFHKHLYCALTQLTCGKPESGVHIALRCMRLAAGQKKVPGPRAFAFVKRLATTCLQLEHHDALATLLQLKQIIRLHPAVGATLENEDGSMSGIYLPELDDPDHCDARSTNLWELCSISNHYHPWVSRIATSMVHPEKVELLPNNLAQKVPEDLCLTLNPYETMEFLPDMKEPREKMVRSKRHRVAPFVPKTQEMRDYLCNANV